MTEAASQRQVTLLSLPNELLHSVVELLEAPDLANIAATCCRLNSLTEPYIWRSLLVRHGSHARKLVRALLRRPERVSFVDNLAICYIKGNEDGIEHLNSVISQMDKLRHLNIETPCTNDEGWSQSQWSCRINYTELFEDSVKQTLPYQPLASLQSVTLHGHRCSEEPFSFGRAGAIFLHPTLRDLTISCTNFESDIKPADIPPEKFKSTALRTLTFIESNVYLSFLEVALSLPKALKELSINERLHAFKGCYPVRGQPTTMNPEFIDVLQIVAPSLKRLVHNPGHIDFKRDVLELNSSSQVYAMEYQKKGSMFTSLKYLETASHSLLKEIISNCVSLETWRLNDTDVSGDVNYTTLLFNLMSAYQRILDMAFGYAICRNRRPLDVEICFSLTGKPVQCARTYWLENSIGQASARTEKVYRIAAILKARGSRLRIFGETFGKYSAFIIPPYLYGEPRPWEQLLYDSAQLWTFMGKDLRDRDESHMDPSLRATCISCRMRKAFCRNEGYGTTCYACVGVIGKCEYPAPSSPWFVS